MQASSSRPDYLSVSYAQSNPIDLTLDDDDTDSSVKCDRKLKRTCSLNRSFNATCDAASATSPARRSSYQSGLSPAMSASSLQPDNRPPDSTVYAPPYGPPPTHLYNGNDSNLHMPHIPSFAGPSNSAAFFQPSPTAATPPALAPASHGPNTSVFMRPPPLNQQQQHIAPRPVHESPRQVIDLTNSPSPPPAMHRPPQLVSQGNLPQDLPPKTPVCIGQLPATALVLYPIGYLLPQSGISSPETEWAPVRLSYEHNAQAKPGCQETIHIRTPNATSPNGDVLPGENFAVVEQKAATVLGPMLGKGLIRLDGRVRRGQPNLPIIPLNLLVYTPKGNITVVANYLHTNGLFLDHPTFPSDVQRIKAHYYYNPHNPPPGGHRTALLANGRPGYTTPGASTPPRWNTVSGKSVEVQRSQVDELFKSLRDGEELGETEPPPEIATKLYPHQKKALTFMLERERERLGFGNKFSSLWQERHNPLSGQTSWYHLVTQREVFEEPREAKGSILADDMGLGKTISCVALLAATLDSAEKFAATPLESPVPPPPSFSADPALSAVHFSGSVWGMPQVALPEPTSAKGKAKAAREHDKLEAEYIRACRIKTRSRATLIVCPLSTVVNWEEQFKEHWRGEVTIVGGSGGTCAPVAQPPSQRPSPSPWSTPTPTPTPADNKPAVNAIAARVREGRPLKVYVYHGNSRRPDPTFLADFDAVITTYSTLAVEFSRQSKSVTADEEEDEDDGNSSDGFVETDDKGNPVIKLPKPKKGGKKRKKNMPGTPGAEASSPLQSVYWFRVVLDEAHSIKEITTVACRACCDLLADRRLCLTGTPVQNKLDDVYALLKFLRLDPFDDKAVWTEFIGTPVKYGQPLGVARLQSIMKCITLRRTKESKAENGQKILSLPPRRDELRYLKFDEQEQALYDQFFMESKAEFNELSNKNEVMKNYVGILQKILRLRQICDHFELVMTKNSSPDAPNYDDLAKAIAKDGINTARAVAIYALLKESGTAQCVECGYELGVPTDGAEGGDACGGYEGEGTKRGGRKSKAIASRSSTRQSSPSASGTHAILTRCQHLFCGGCFRNSCFPGWPNPCSSAPHACIVCQTALSSTDAIDMPLDAMPADMVSKKKAGKREKRQKGVNLQNFHPSTKVKALIGDLMQFSRANPYSTNYDPSSIEVQMVDDQGNTIEEGVTKTVVFSQWTSMLDKIEDALEAAGIRYDRLDGTMKRDDRTRAMEALKHDPGCEVLLVSLKAGGVGLNLTAAQRVYLMDPYWNPAVENQAVDRIHRLGQTRPVTTVKLIIENSIEDRLLEVQKKKTELANMTLGQNFSKAELLQRRMEELNQLFKA